MGPFPFRAVRDNRCESRVRPSQRVLEGVVNVTSWETGAGLALAVDHQDLPNVAATQICSAYREVVGDGMREAFEIAELQVELIGHLTQIRHLLKKAVEPLADRREIQFEIAHLQERLSLCANSLAHKQELIGRLRRGNGASISFKSVPVDIDGHADGCATVTHMLLNVSKLLLIGVEGEGLLEKPLAGAGAFTQDPATILDLDLTELDEIFEDPGKFRQLIGVTTVVQQGLKMAADTLESYQAQLSAHKRALEEKISRRKLEMYDKVDPALSLKRAFELAGLTKAHLGASREGIANGRLMSLQNLPIPA
ncbi:hypothetical protein PUV47_03715 [Pseudovibrio exalbescens]|nr:hypothetical protein [Pseudovibrio exalbescens]